MFSSFLIIRRAAGLVPQDEFERQRLMQQAFDLKQRYGEYLRDETDNVCAFGSSLYIPVPYTASYCDQTDKRRGRTDRRPADYLF